MKIQKSQAYVVYFALIAASIFYLGMIEQFHTKAFVMGGHDYKFSAFDVALVAMGLIGVFMSVVSFAAYARKTDERLFIIALAFLFFTIQTAFNIVYNFYPGGYKYVGIAAEGFELLMILTFFAVLLKK